MSENDTLWLATTTDGTHYEGVIGSASKDEVQIAVKDQPIPFVACIAWAELRSLERV